MPIVTKSKPTITISSRIGLKSMMVKRGVYFLSGCELRRIFSGIVLTALPYATVTLVTSTFLVAAATIGNSSCE
jgi:hypothetical protein